MKKYTIFLFAFIFCGLRSYSQSVCNNEDFEVAGLSFSPPQTLTIATTGGIQGWVIASGTNTVTPQSTSSCLQTGCCIDTTSFIVSLIGTNSSGYIDPIIGSSYPIYSVFGNTLNSGSSINGFSSYGNWFVKLNNQSPGSGITQISKSFVVNTSNANFKYGFVAVLNDGTPGQHCCCSNSGVSINFKDCLGNTLATSSQFSVAPDAVGSCSPLGSCTTGPVVSFSPTPSTGWVFNKWKTDSIDLSTWMGTCLTIEFRAFDCTYFGHAGYAYFDTQCGPLLTTLVNSLSDNHGFKIYPNPTSGNFNIDIAKEINNGEIELRNILGQTVHKQTIKQGTNPIKTENLAKGIYNYSVYSKKEVVSVGKVVIE